MISLWSSRTTNTFVLSCLVLKLEWHARLAKYAMCAGQRCKPQVYISEIKCAFDTLSDSGTFCAAVRWRDIFAFELFMFIILIYLCLYYKYIERKCFFNNCETPLSTLPVCLHYLTLSTFFLMQTIPWFATHGQYGLLWEQDVICMPCPCITMLFIVKT